MKFARHIFIILSLFSIFSCNKGDSVPNQSFYLDIYLNDPSYISLNAIGGWVYTDGGVRGLIVYRKSLNEFIAFERNCTYDPSSPAPCGMVSMESNNIFAADTCCGSKFQITDGLMAGGPAPAPLKRYNTDYDGSSVLHIYN